MMLYDMFYKLYAGRTMTCVIVDVQQATRFESYVSARRNFQRLLSSLINWRQSFLLSSPCHEAAPKIQHGFGRAL